MLASELVHPYWGCRKIGIDIQNDDCHPGGEVRPQCMTSASSVNWRAACGPLGSVRLRRSSLGRCTAPRKDSEVWLNRGAVAASAGVRGCLMGTQGAEFYAVSSRGPSSLGIQQTTAMLLRNTPTAAASPLTGLVLPDEGETEHCPWPARHQTAAWRPPDALACRPPIRWLGRTAGSERGRTGRGRSPCWSCAES
jgi:hypothetical protein